MCAFSEWIEHRLQRDRKVRVKAYQRFCRLSRYGQKPGYERPLSARKREASAEGKDIRRKAKPKILPSFQKNQS
jgi:hypothetical protein